MFVSGRKVSVSKAKGREQGTAFVCLWWGGKRPGLKATLSWGAAIRGVEEVAEKLGIWAETDESKPWWLKPPIILRALLPGMNPRPSARTSFSAACKANSFCGVYGTRSAALRAGSEVLP